MPIFPTSILWRRVDTDGCDHVLVDDRSGLRVRGVAVAADPLPHTCHYELATDERWATLRLEVAAEGAGWRRTLSLERTGGRWRAATSEEGGLGGALAAAGLPEVGPPGTQDLDRLADALDVDLAAAPLFNTLPVRRLRLLGATPGTEHRLTMAWVLLPSLEVQPSEQVYTVLGERRVRYASGTFTADLTLDEAGFVTDYPGLASVCG